MTEDIEHYADRVDQLFCRKNAPFGGFAPVGEPTVLVPDVMFRASLQRVGDESDRFEVTVFEQIDGFAGELWERSAKSMLRLRSLEHPGLPEIVRAQKHSADRIAFTLTRELGQPLNLDEAVVRSSQDPIWAFEQFSVLLDALKELHTRRILHRALVPDAFRADIRDDMGHDVRLSLSRFEMSALISNIVRRVGAGDPAETRRIIRRIYLASVQYADSADQLDTARHLTYLAPEMHPYIFDDQAHSRRDWHSTDTFGLGVLGWELFCGGLSQTLPEELTAVAVGEGEQRMSALINLHQAMTRYLNQQTTIPESLRQILASMISPQPDDRPSTFQLTQRIEQDWDTIRAVWEKSPDKPYLVAFMPDESTDTIFNRRGWISRNPEDAAGREELREFYVEELKGAFLAHSPTGARGYVTGRDDDVLSQAEWILVGTRAVWFCAFLRKAGVNGPGERFEDVLLIKYLRDRDQAGKLAAALPRRRVPDIEPVAFRRGQSVDHLRAGRPSWVPLTESVRQQRHRDVRNESFLQSMDFLLEYQRVELAARTYPFVSDGGPGLVQLSWDRQRDGSHLLRWPLLNAYAQSASRRPPLGDFMEDLDVTEADEGGKKILIDIDPNHDRPSFSGGNSFVAEFVDRLDQDTVRVRVLGGSMPTIGWLRPRSESGTPAQLARQQSARRQLEYRPSLVRALYDPPQFDLGRHQWQVEVDPSLLGNAPSIIRDMLSRQEFYALQGPPGSGKTHTVAQALKRHLMVDPGTRVLVSAQSNQALDNIAAQLINTLPAGALILREMSKSGDTARVDPRIQSITLIELIGRLVADIRTKVRDRLSGKPEDLPPLTNEEHDIATIWLKNVESNQIELGERIKAAANVVLATCSIAATVLDDARDPTSSFDWVILEEAAKAWPTEVVIPLVLGTRWTLVGDHRQLGAHRGEEVGRFLDDLEHSTDESVRPHVEAKADHLRVLNLFKSLFERGPALDGDHPALGRLDTQFRMHRDIAQPISRAFYPLREPPNLPVLDEDHLPVSFLHSDESATVPHGVFRPSFLSGHALVWLDTDGCVDCVDKGWWSNDGEVALVERLVDSMDPPSAGPGAEGQGSLVVLTPYRAQLEKLQRRGVLANRVHTVHSYQGGQADRVIVSLVRSTRRGDRVASNVGHVGQDEVANVLLSRAQRLMVIVGNLDHFTRNAGPNWSTITSTVRRYGHVVSAANWGTS